MGKSHKHMKRLKTEKAKVKLKTNKNKRLPKGLNVTDPSFNVKKIIIREQFKQHEETEILSRRKLNLKDLLSRLQHHNSTIRQDAVRELKELLLQYPLETLNSQLNSLLQGISALSLDKEKYIRRDALKVLNYILSPISSEQLAPFADILISYLRCGMTHIDPNIKEDSLLFLDILVKNCGHVLAINSDKVLPNFLDMISKMHNETKPGRQLMITLNSTNTSVKWRNKVLERLAGMLESIVNYIKLERTEHCNSTTKVVLINKNTRCIPIYKRMNSQGCKVDFEKIAKSEDCRNKENLDTSELVKYINLLMPLMLDSWIEVCPKGKNSSFCVQMISEEASTLLQNIVAIIQSIIEYIDMLKYDDNRNIKNWFRNSFQNICFKNLLSRFPYTTVRTIEKVKKEQEDFADGELSKKCLIQNLGICHIYIWFTSFDGSIIDDVTKKYCRLITVYLNDKVANWSTHDNPALPQLTKLLRTLFLKASKVWYTNYMSMECVLKTTIHACARQPRRDLQLQLYDIVSDIILNHTLIELHRENIFKHFISTLPCLLLRSSIHDSTIHMINKAVLQHREWLQATLVEKQKAIIENANKIEIIGSENDKRSRLMICNLFYFLNEQIYY